MFKRTHTLNENAFDTLTEESAYWVGFLMADGCVSGRYLRLGLAEIDLPHIEKLKTFLGSSHVVAYSPEGVYQFAVSSRRLASALAKYGVVPRKTHSAQVIGLEHNRHFWRGVIDGDGSLGIYRSGRNMLPRPRIQLVGSRELLTQFIAFVKARFPECRLNMTPSRSIYYVGTNGKFARALVALLYSDCSTYLGRKYDKAVEILSSVA